MRIINILIIGFFFIVKGYSQNIKNKKATISNKITTEQWKEDLDYMVKKIEDVHPMPFKWIKKDFFFNEVEKLKSSLHNLTTEQIAMEMMALVASIKDGHTKLHPKGQNELNRWIPIRFYRFTNGIFITSIHQDYKHLAGKKVVSIEGFDPIEIQRKIIKYSSTENYFDELEEVFLMSNPYILKELGYAKSLDSISITIESEAKKEETVEIKSIKANFSMDWEFHGEMFGPRFSKDHKIKYVSAFNDKSSGEFLNEHEALSKSDFNLPLHLRSRISWWFKYLENGSILYMQINHVLNRKNQSFKDFYTKMLEDIDKKEVKKFVIDVRYNSGGNGNLLNDFIKEIIKRSHLYESGKLYVITGRKTFSAVISHLIPPLFKFNTNPIIIGEPSSARMNHCGNPASYTLPNSKFKLYLSTEYYQGTFWGDKSNVIPVEMPFSFSSQDYFSKKDPAMEFVLEDYIPIIELIKNQEIEKAYSNFKELQKKHGSISWWKPFNQSEMNSLGYISLRKGDLENAIKIFEMNTLAYPQSSNAWDSLGEAYMKKRDKKKTYESYKRALEINPDYPNATMAKSILNKLKKQN